MIKIRAESGEAFCHGEEVLAIANEPVEVELELGPNKWNIVIRGIGGYVLPSVSPKSLQAAKERIGRIFAS